MDFQKAFNSLPHTKLLIKLWTYGITRDLCLWFKAYLMGRFQCVSINPQHSMFLPFLSGVAQGSRPSNDLPQFIKYSHTLMFADYIKCILQITSCQDSIYLHKIISMKSHIGVLNGNSILI